MNIILTITCTSLVNMIESGCTDLSKNGSFHDEDEQASTSGLQRYTNDQCNLLQNRIS